MPLELLVEREGADSMLGASRTALRIPSFIDDVISSMRQMGKCFSLWKGSGVYDGFRYVCGGDLPSEWEYSAKGSDGRNYPWGEKLDTGTLANFADRRTNFAWRDPDIDDGYAETSPVGAYPRGVSPFGIEDMAGNVFEWCFDCFEAYKGKERVNPRGVAAAMPRLT